MTRRAPPTYRDGFRKLLPQLKSSFSRVSLAACQFDSDRYELFMSQLAVKWHELLTGGFVFQTHHVSTRCLTGDAMLREANLKGLSSAVSRGYSSINRQFSLAGTNRRSVADCNVQIPLNSMQGMTNSNNHLDFSEEFDLAQLPPMQRKNTVFSRFFWVFFHCIGFKLIFGLALAMAMASRAYSNAITLELLSKTPI